MGLGLWVRVWVWVWARVRVRARARARVRPRVRLRVRVRVRLRLRLRVRLRVAATHRIGLGRHEECRREQGPAPVVLGRGKQVVLAVRYAHFVDVVRGGEIVVEVILAQLGAPRGCDHDVEQKETAVMQFQGMQVCQPRCHIGGDGQ